MDWLFLSLAILVILGFVLDAARLKAWGWVVSLVIVFPVAALAWIIAGRRQYLEARCGDGHA